MMRQMRENTKWIMLITAAAFVALMVFEWGMDASGQSGGGGSLGEVGGTNVSVQHYQNVYRNLYDQVQRSQERPISSAQNREVEDMAWNEVVNQLLIESELDRRGIGVSDEEIRQAVRTSPPAEFRSDPNFQTNGQFDPQRYQQFLQQAGQDPQFLMQLEQYYRDVIPRSKLMRQVTSGVWVSDRELWQDWRDRNETVEVTFVDLRPDVLIPDSDVQVSPAEIEAYYEEHRDDYQIPARAQVRYTYLSASPTAADSIAVRDRAEDIRERLIAGEEDFADVAAIESADDATAADGGSLGTITRGEMPAAFEEVAFSLPVGEISEPFETEFGLHIIEVLSRDEDSAEVRQILLELERTADSEIRLLTLADSLETLGRNLTLDEAASELGRPVRSGQITEDYAILAGVGIAEEAQTWIFEEREEGVDEISPVFESPQAFYMLEVTAQAPARHLNLDEVSEQIEALLRHEKKLDRTMEIASGFVEEVRDGMELEALAEREGLTVSTAGPFNRRDPVAGLGTRNAVIGAAFSVPEGEVASPARADGRVVILRVDQFEEADRAAWEAQKEVQRMQLTTEIRQARLARWLDGLRETTRIRDQRAEFFRQAEEAADVPQIPMAF